MSTSKASSVDSIVRESPDRRLHNSSSWFLTLLPDELIMDCLAHVPRRYYPACSLVCTTFRRLIASPGLYKRRLELLITENVLYVVLRSQATETPQWYTLNPRPFDNESKLVLVPSFPSIPCWGMSIIAVDSKIYVLGGFINNHLVSTGFVVEYPSYACHVLPSMKQARGCAAVGVIDGKLYVIGGCDYQSLNWVEAFDIKTQTWETVSVETNVQMVDITLRSFVMYDKIYIMDRRNSFVYDPKQGRVERDLLLNTHWNVCSCVIDHRLYTFHAKNELWVFDPITWVWNIVKGLEDLHRKNDGSRMVNHGGKLVILFRVDEGRSRGIWNTEIGLEMREGVIWGKILRSNLVIPVTCLPYIPSIVQSLAVTSLATP